MPILIYGCRKAGTTLFQRLVDGADGVFVHPSETKIKYFLNIQRKTDGNQLPFSSKKFDSVFPKIFRSAKKGWQQVDSQVYRELIKKSYKSITNLKDFIDLDIEASIQSMGFKEDDFNDWAIKEISGNTESIFNAFLQSYPNGKIIVIVRDPRQNSNSIYREKIKTNSSFSYKKNRFIASEPYRIFSNVHNFIEHKQVYPVFYEDVVSSTERVMRGVSNFINVPYSDTLTKPTIKGEICKVPSSSVKTEKVFKKEKKLSYGIQWNQYLHIRFQEFLNRDAFQTYTDLRRSMVYKV
jgi:hypothetical protein